jgi:hypothetical protein
MNEGAVPPQASEVTVWRTTPVGRWLGVGMFALVVGAVLAVVAPIQPWWVSAVVGAVAGGIVGYLVYPVEWTRLIGDTLSQRDRDGQLARNLNDLRALKWEFVPYSDPDIHLVFSRDYIPVTDGPSTLELRRAIWEHVRARADYWSIVSASDPRAVEALREGSTP